MANPLHRLSIRGRMFTILILFMVPIVILGYQLDAKLQEAIDFSETESKGVAFVKPLFHLLDEVADYNVARAQSSKGDTNGATKAAESVASIDKLFDELVAVDARVGTDLDFTTEGLAKHKAGDITVTNLKKKWDELKTSATFSPEAGEAIINDITKMIATASNTSGLILDGDLDTYYIVDVLFNTAPALLQSLAKIKSDGFYALHDNGGILTEKTSDEVFRVSLMIEGSYLPKAHDGISTALSEDANFHGISESFQKNVPEKLAAYETAAKDALTVLGQLHKGGSMDADKYLEAMDIPHDGTADLAGVQLDELEKMIDVRVNDLKTLHMQVMGASIASVVLAYLLFFIVSNSISRPIGKLQESLGRIAEGDTDLEIPLSHGKDEISRLYEASEKLRHTVEDAFRLKQMVEDMPTATMAVDVRDNLKINYLNNASKALLTELQSYLPVSASQMMGQSIDIFHKNPKHQRDMLANPNNLPHRARITIGPETISLLVSPIYNAKHVYVGAMLTWEKITARVKLADTFESSVKSVVTEVSASAVQMRSNAERLSTLASETKSNSGMVASSATTAAQTATQVAAAAEELTAAIGEISAQVQKSSSVANQASSQAESINQSMHVLVEKSNRVGEVIQFITNIASQINLLALNATIESARAGEAGRGFAVVASEVKNLANQTAKATEEIVQQVQSMQEATQGAVHSVGEIIAIINEISQSTAGVAAAVEEQSAATNEISRNIAHTASGTNEISRSIGAVEQGADETGNSSRQVLDSAKALSGQAALLSEKVDEFLRTVRAS